MLGRSVRAGPVGAKACSRLSKVHDFNRSLAFSHSQSEAPWWEEVYREAFTTFESMWSVRQDGWAQRAGIDRQVLLRDGTVLKIDEKVRTEDWSDILLEYWSDEEKRVPGWVAKDLSCDYIAYALVPSRTCYLLPFQLLRRVWKKHRAEWVGTYQRIEAHNNTYRTISVAVPPSVLLSAIADAIVVRWTGSALTAAAGPV